MFRWTTIFLGLFVLKSLCQQTCPQDYTWIDGQCEADLNQLMSPANQPSQNRTFASQTDIGCTGTCLYAYADSGCSSSTDPIYANIIDGQNGMCTQFDASFRIASVLFWLGDKGAQSITFYSKPNCTAFEMADLTTDSGEWSCYSISQRLANNNNSLLSYAASYY